MVRRLPSLIFAVAMGLCAAQPAQPPQPRIVDPGGPGKAPSDAIVLFDGRDVSQWRRADGSPTGCQAIRGEMVCATGAGDAWSKVKFRSAQIHVEVAVPDMPEEKGQRRGNSGIFLHGRYEIQILDSYHNETYPTGHAGALYGQAAPLVIASRPPGQWQTFDIIFHAPQCDASGNLLRHGTVTVLFNGILVQDHVEIQEEAVKRPRAGGKTCAEGVGEPGPLMLQDHSGFKNPPKTVMRFRNIWLRPLAD